MEKQSLGVFESWLDPALLTSTTPLQISYSNDQPQAAIIEAKNKWQQFQTKIDDLKRNLINCVVQKIEKERIKQFSEGIRGFLKLQAAQTVHDYNMLASLDLALQENERLLEYSNVMKEISLLVRDWYSGLSSNLLTIATGGLQNKLVLDITAAMSSTQKDLSQVICVLESNESAHPEKKNPTKRLSTIELSASLSCFEEIALGNCQKKLDDLLLYIRGVAESECKDLFEYISSSIAGIIAKLNTFENDSSLESAADQILSQSIDEFFSNAYSIELSFLESKLKDVLNEQAFQRIEQSVIEKAMLNLSSNQEHHQLAKIRLTDYFFQAKAAVIQQKVPPTCLKIMKETKGVRKINVLDAEPHKQFIIQGENPLVIKYNRVYLVTVKDPDFERGSETSETILHTTKEEIVKDYHRVELKIGFLPRNLEFPREETMIISFVIRLVKSILSKSEQHDNTHLGQSQTLDVDIGTFLAHSVSFIAETLLEKEKQDKKSVVLQHDKNPLGNPTRSPRKQLNVMKGTTESILSPTEQHYEESKSFVFEGEPLSLENIDSVESTDMTENDADWEASDTQVFLQLLEQDKCKLLNDLRTLKIVSGLQDYIFIDKPTSSEIFTEYLATLNTGLPKKSKDLRSSALEKALTSSNADIVRGIVLLFPPVSDFYNIVALRVDFETYSRNFFALDSRGTDLNTLKTVFKMLGKLVKRTVISRAGKKKSPKFKDNYIFMKLDIDEGIGLKCFENFYFPYIYTLRQELNSSCTETISAHMLKGLLGSYLQAAYSSPEGIERVRNLVEVYHLYTNRFTNIFIIEEFNDLDNIQSKIKQYLRLCFVDSIEENAQKMKSILIFCRIRNEKLRTYDTVLIFLEYIHPTQVEKGESSPLGQQRFHVFGDAYLHLQQVRGIIKSFFKEQELALNRVRLDFYQMKKLKTDTNLLFFDRSLFSTIFFILLNEQVPIADIVCICRLCPAIQYRYLNATFEKNRSTQLATNKIPKKFDLELLTVRVIGRDDVELVDEIHNTISILELNQPGNLKWLVELTNLGEYKHIVAPMKPSGKNDGAFKVNLKELKLPTDPFILIIPNYDFNATNPNICNIIEPDGSVFVLNAVAQGTMEQSKPNKKQQAAIVKSIETVKKSLPKEKTGYKYNVIHHEMHLKNLSFDNVQALFDFIIIFYLLKYRSYKDPWFFVSENSILSLIFVDLRICFHNAPDCIGLVRSLQDNHFILREKTLIQRTHKNYTEDNLISLFGVFLANKNTRNLIFCVQNDLEYSFHLVIKDAKTNTVLIMVAAIKDQSAGGTAKHFYDEMLSSLQDGVMSSELKCDFIRYELESLPSFFFSIDPNLLSLALANVAHVFEGQDYFKTTQKYLQMWYRPTILSSQFMVITKSF